MSYTHTSQQYSQGFIALLSVLMVSVMLLVSSISLTTYSMTVRSATLHLENKAKSEALATACLNVAQIALINDSDFETHNKSVALEGASCNIEYIEKHTPMHGTHRIKVHASSSGATTNYLADISASTSLITRLEEVVN